MIILNNNVIESDSIIDKTEFPIILKADKEAVYFLILTTNDNQTYVYSFSNIGDNLTYKTRLILTESIIKHLENSKINVLTCIGDFKEKSNTLKLKFDINKIKQDARKELSDSLLDIKIEMKSLEKKISDLTSGKVLKGLNITNLEYLKQGMVPVAIDDKGNFVGQFIFKDHVMEVNGIKPIDGQVSIEAENIKYKESKTVKDALDLSIETTVSLYDLVNQIIKNEKEIREKLDQLTIDFNTHINSGIV